MAFIMNCEARLKSEEIVFTCFYINVSKIDLRKWAMNLTIACSDLNSNTILREYTVEVIIMQANKNQAFTSLIYDTTKLNSVALVRKRTIPTKRPPLVGEVSTNFCG
jgi:hypothetical protein